MRLSAFLCVLGTVVAVWTVGGATRADAQTANDGMTPQPLPTITVMAPKPNPQDRQKKPTQPAPGQNAGASSPAVGVSRGDLSTAASALPAASTTIDASTLQRMPIASYGDIFRSLPGFNVANYGQGGLGYGLSMRGYTDAEHGRDIAYYIDGVPVNDVSSIHTPNYADLNILLPETVKSIEVIRGPFSVEFGDSNLGGSVNITTKDSEPFASVSGSGGSFATGRALATYSSTGGTYQPFLVYEGYNTDGYRDNNWLDRYDAFNKITTQLSDGSQVSLRMQAYGTNYGAPGYISRDQVESGAISPKTAFNPTDGGNKYLENLVANYSSGAADQELSGMLFFSHDVFNRFADFCSPSCQRWQQDERSTVGGRIRKVWTGDFADAIPVQVLVGANWRSDFIAASQAPTTSRVVNGPLTTNLGIDQSNLGTFAQVQVKPVSWLKLTAGGRFDQFFYDVTDKITPSNSTNIAPGIASPKAGIALIPTSWLELYANYGQGFRSIDAATELIGNPGIAPFKITSEEIGIQFRFNRFSLLADVWTTYSEHEAIVTPASETIAGHARRDGYDLDGRFYVIKDKSSSVALFANYGAVRAVLLDQAPAYYVPNVPQYVANVGVDFNAATHNGQRILGSTYVSFIGKKNLTEDGLITTSPYERVTGHLAYQWPDGWTVFTEATWYPGNTDSEVAFNFGNATGASSSDVYISPMPVLQFMAGLKYQMPTGNALPNSKTVTQ